ncbi:MAG: DUF2207 domain-containing protein [Muribaculaceae bacterium]|nr:DUF2207 domain-containing protein [Muribaculaceae bacterium]
MRKFMKYGFMLMLALLAALPVEGHRLVDLDIRVLLNDKGHARVVETRTMDIDDDDGTEAFIKMFNMGVMEVGEFSVTDETGVDYEVEKKWDIDRPRSAKTHRCGYHKTDEGVELCWGIGQGGRRVYTVRYTLTRMVKSYDDFDGFNFMFYEADDPYAEETKVTIERENGAFTPADTRMWAFRYYGEIVLEDGKIVATTDRPMTSKGDGIIVMAVFNKGLFHPVTDVKGSLVELLAKPALEGSDYDLKDCVETLAAMKEGKFTEGENGDLAMKSSLMGSSNVMGGNNGGTMSELAESFQALFILIGWCLLAIIALWGISSVYTSFKREKKLKSLFGNNRHEVEVWYRDIPYNGDLNKTYGVLKAVEPKQATNANLVAACVMRMMYQNTLQLQYAMDQRGNPVEMLAVTRPADQCPYDKSERGNVLLYYLQRLMYDAAGEDHVLQPKELEKYMKAKPVENRPVVKVLFSLLETSDINLKTVQRSDAEQVFGLKKYLQEFTLLDERTVREVSLWKEYLVHATLYGIADQVRNDLKQIWPDYTQIDPIAAQLEVRPSFCSTFARSALWGMTYVHTYETPSERAARLQRERSSGGGGRSSWGGGGGHSGGGGSGVR